MRLPRHIRARGRLAASFLLFALLFRAYVPVGYMPAAGAPLLLELCPEGLSAPAAHHEHHQPSHQPHEHYEHCPFGSTPAGGPLSLPLAWQPPAPVSAEILTPADAASRPVRPSRAHAPRGPPALA